MNAYPTVSTNGVVTHVLVPIEDYAAMIGSPPVHATVAQPSDDEVSEAMAILQNPATKWHSADDILQRILRDGVEAARKHAKLTQSQLAGRVGFSQSRISRIESDSNAASIAILRRIAEALAKTSERRAG